MTVDFDLFTTPNVVQSPDPQFFKIVRQRVINLILAPISAFKKACQCVEH